MMAFSNQGYSEFKTTLFQLAGDIFMAIEKPTEACGMYWLAKQVRNEQLWKVPQELLDALKNCNQKPEVDAATLYEQLKQKHLPITEKQAGEPGDKPETYHGNGLITRILHPGSNGDGFITDEAGNGIYFRFGVCRIKPEAIAEQLRVGFVAKLTERNGKKVYSAVKVFSLGETGNKND